MNRISSARWTIFAVAIAFALGGCSLFHHRDNYYAKARETRPLEVPPDLDSPPTSDELVVPDVGASNPSPASTTATTPVAGGTPPAAMEDGNGLRVSDTVENTWRRVGVALDKAEVGTISARDESAHSYTLDVEGLRVPASSAEPRRERHWYTAIWHRIQHPLGGGKRTVSGKLVVTVAAEGSGSRVDVQGPPGADSNAAKQQVLQALRDSLSSPAAETASAGAPPAAAAAVSVGAGLHIADNVDHTWQRVGLALERAKLGTISARDETNHSYTLDVEGLRVTTVHHQEQPKEHHWYSAIVDRILYPTGHHHKDDANESKPVSGKLVVRVVSDGSGSRVNVESAPGTDSTEAARRVLQVLQSRLG